MECRKWEDVGLLYSAQELGLSEMKEYESHLAVCSECRSELSLYRQEQKRFFTAEILGEAPSAKVSAGILRVCADQRSARVAAVARNRFSPRFSARRCHAGRAFGVILFYFRRRYHDEYSKCAGHENSVIKGCCARRRCGSAGGGRERRRLFRNNSLHNPGYFALQRGATE